MTGTDLTPIPTAQRASPPKRRVAYRSAPYPASLISRWGIHARRASSYAHRSRIDPSAVHIPSEPSGPGGVVGGTTKPVRVTRVCTALIESGFSNAPV
jgi:hypothetical protein